jgi:hypothetical protein
MVSKSQIDVKVYNKISLNIWSDNTADLLHISLQQNSS